MYLVFQSVFTPECIFIRFKSLFSNSHAIFTSAISPYVLSSVQFIDLVSLLIEITAYQNVYEEFTRKLRRILSFPTTQFVRVMTSSLEFSVDLEMVRRYDPSKIKRYQFAG